MLSVKCLRPPAARSGAGTRLSTNRSVAAHQARADVLLHTGRGTCRCAVQRARFGRCAHRAALYTHRRKQMLRACRCGCDYHLLFKTVMSSPGCGTLEPLRTSEPENLDSFPRNRNLEPLRTSKNFPAPPARRPGTSEPSPSSRNRNLPSEPAVS